MESLRTLNFSYTWIRYNKEIIKYFINNCKLNRIGTRNYPTDLSKKVEKKIPARLKKLKFELLAYI